VRVIPRASRAAIEAPRAGALVVRLTAAPVEGQANRALVAMLARALDVPPSAIELIRGAAGREKVLRVAGLTAADVRGRLGWAAA
jgi:hypothetical protein